MKVDLTLVFDVESTSKRRHNYNVDLSLKPSTLKRRCHSTSKQGCCDDVDTTVKKLVESTFILTHISTSISTFVVNVDSTVNQRNFAHWAGSNPGSDTISARVTLDKLLTHIVSLPRFDVHSSTYGVLTKVFTFFTLDKRLCCH